METAEKTATPPQFKVKRDPSGTNLLTALSVSEERASELGNIIRDALTNSADYITAISIATEKATCNEEVAFISFTVGAFSQRSHDPMSALMRLMNKD